MPKNSEPEWYKPRKYIHFDAPLSVSDAVALTTDPEAIANRAFWPLISFSIR
ncbi:MAG: hypothetical protein KF838_06420 [Phycisphaeraceae bacterium]|nr:MAG: hypothetical protein KF838_06420 [Phycisphaeraceae bacterium]